MGEKCCGKHKDGNEEGCCKNKPPKQNAQGTLAKIASFDEEAGIIGFTIDGHNIANTITYLEDKEAKDVNIGEAVILYLVLNMHGETPMYEAVDWDYQKSN